MKKLLWLLCLLAFAACDDGATVKKPGPDNTVVTDQDYILPDSDDPTGDDLLNDDGQLINDDGQIINDDGQIINDDGQIINDDNEVVNDDGEVVPDDDETSDQSDGSDGSDFIVTDDGPLPFDDDPAWPDDGPMPFDDDPVWPDDGPMPTDDGPIGPDQDWTDDVKPDDDSTTVTCGDNNNCKQNEYCAKPAGTCGTFLAGTCEDRPELCPPLYSPVCGCDGQTYSSECDAHSAGVNVDYSGECGGEPGCYSNEECGDSSGNLKQFCLYDVGVCWGPGTCTEYPTTCGDIYAPVCGCDYVTYENECMAHISGVSVMYEGECKEEKYSTLYYYYDQDTMNAPEAKIVIETEDGAVEFIGADLMTRTTSGYTTVYLDTVFYGLTDDGSKIEFHLKLSTIGWSIPKTVTLDGGDNYARWTRLGNELVGDLYGDVTIQQYNREDTVITLIEINGDYLSYTPNIVP